MHDGRSTEVDRLSSSSPAERQRTARNTNVFPGALLKVQPEAHQGSKAFMTYPTNELQLVAWLGQQPVKQANVFLARQPSSTASSLLSKFFSAFLLILVDGEPLVLVNGEPLVRDDENTTLGEYMQGCGSIPAGQWAYHQTLPSPISRMIIGGPLQCDTSAVDIVMDSSWYPPSPAPSCIGDTASITEASDEASHPPSKRKRLPDTDEVTRRRELNRVHKQESRRKQAARQLDDVRSELMQNIQDMEEDHRSQIERLQGLHALEIEKLREAHASELYGAQQAREAEIRALRETRDSVYVDTLEKITKYHDEIRKLEIELRAKDKDIYELSRRTVELEAQLWRKKEAFAMRS